VLFQVGGHHRRAAERAAARHVLKLSRALGGKAQIQHHPLGRIRLNRHPQVLHPQSGGPHGRAGCSFRHSLQNNQRHHPGCCSRGPPPATLMQPPLLGGSSRHWPVPVPEQGAD
jgi:hypothetical protein